MAALLRSQDTRDLATVVREWQSRHAERQLDSDRKSPVARLTEALINLFRDVLLSLSDREDFPSDIFISLDRSRSCFSLWSDGHGIANGRLDDKFQRSQNLRRTTMKTLAHISCTLIDRLLPLASISDPNTDRLCASASSIIEEVDLFTHDVDDSSSNATSDFGTENAHEIAEDLKTDVECLIQLDPVLRNPVMDPKPELTRAEVPETLLWMPHQVFIDKIENTFPLADTQLLSYLGKVNYERYLRCQAERDSQEDDDSDEGQFQEHAGTIPASKFHDSGLGSSVAATSSYAETVMSYTHGTRSVRIPPLSEEAKRGEPFPCVACGRSVTMINNSQWKRHLYLDLQPYLCLDASCQRGGSVFSSQANWVLHLALDHAMEPGWGQIQCPLCKGEVGPGKINITTHLGRHLEEISLSALPAGLDSESSSEASGSEASGSEASGSEPDCSLELDTVNTGEGVSQNIGPRQSEAVAAPSEADNENGGTGRYGGPSEGLVTAWVAAATSSPNQQIEVFDWTSTSDSNERNLCQCGKAFRRPSDLA
ncbi:hypothetical protein ACJ41O_001269 [Fusarium nematophilum]